MGGKCLPGARRAPQEMGSKGGDTQRPPPAPHRSRDLVGPSGRLSQPGRGTHVGALLPGAAPAAAGEGNGLGGGKNRARWASEK